MIYDIKYLKTRQEIFMKKKRTALYIILIFRQSIKDINDEN
jgi:hypothetical protein